MKVYTIEWHDCEGHEVIASFSSERARDETFRSIEAVPWHHKPGYIGYDDWFERRVAVGRKDGWANDETKDKPIHGRIYCGEFEVHDAPLEVFDLTDRKPYVRRLR